MSASGQRSHMARKTRSAPRTLTRKSCTRATRRLSGPDVVAGGPTCPVYVLPNGPSQYRWRVPTLLGADRDGASLRPRLRAAASSDTGRAAGLAVAVLTTNVVALVFTVVFARVLGATGYGSLAALLSSFIILMVPGSALQIETAREVSRAMAAGDPSAGTDTRVWLRQLAFAVVVGAILAGAPPAGVRPRDPRAPPLGGPRGAGPAGALE